MLYLSNRSARHYIIGSPWSSAPPAARGPAAAHAPWRITAAAGSGLPDSMWAEVVKVTRVEGVDDSRMVPEAHRVHETCRPTTRSGFQSALRRLANAHFFQSKIPRRTTNRCEAVALRTSALHHQHIYRQQQTIARQGGFKRAPHCEPRIESGNTTLDRHPRRVPEVDRTHAARR
jgi:hypothetical protein